MRETKIEQSVIINLPAKDIFTYVSDVESLSDWISVVIAVRKASPGSIRAGDVVRMTIRFLGRWLEMTQEVIEYEPYHLITLKSISGVSPCVFSWQFEAIEGVGTKVSQEAAIHIHNKGRFPGVAEPVIEGMARRQIEYDLLTLKDMLESNATSAF